VDPVFTIPYPEYCIANQLQGRFPTSQGFSLFVPASRQEKGIDLLLMKRTPHGRNVITIQVKSSRTYSPRPTKSLTTKRFRYYTWFNVFDVPEEADYTFLVGLLPLDQGRTTKKHASWWEAVALVFSQKEIERFLRGIKTKGGKPDRMFGFGFDGPDEIIQTRGDEKGRFLDYSDFLLANRAERLWSHLDGS